MANSRRKPSTVAFSCKTKDSSLEAQSSEVGLGACSVTNPQRSCRAFAEQRRNCVEEQLDGREVGVDEILEVHGETASGQCQEQCQSPLFAAGAGLATLWLL